MAVPEQIPVVDYVADGIVKKFDVPFEYDQQSDLHVYVDGAEPTIDKYFFADNAFNFYIAPTNGQGVKIKRITPKERDTDYNLHTNTVRPKALNTDFDRLWYVLQEVFSDVGGLSQTVQDEIIARIQGDEDLLNQLTAEISARMLGDEAVTEDLKNYVNQVIGAIINDPNFNGIDANKVNDASGETQQQVNYNGGSKWHSRVGGYKLNERVVLTNGDIVKSTIDGNTNDPNVDTTGWVKDNSASQIFDQSLNLYQSELNSIYSKQLLTTEMFHKWPAETDDTPRLQRAFDESFTKQQELLLVGNFTASDTLYARFNFDGYNSEIVYPADFNKTGILYGADKALTSNRLSRTKASFPFMRTTNTSPVNTWTNNTGSTAIVVMNSMEGKFKFRGSTAWETGVHFLSNGTDANYNIYELGAHTFSKIPVLSTADGTVTKASNNQNTYIGGRMAVALASVRVSGISLMKFVVKGETASSINNNTLLNPSVEGAADEYAILFENEGLHPNNVLSNNTIISPRLETGNVDGKKIGFIGERSRRNLIIGGYNVFSTTISETNGANSNSFLNTEGMLLLSGSSGSQPLLTLRNQSGIDAPLMGAFVPSTTDYSDVLKSNFYMTSQYAYAGAYVAGQTFKRFRLSLSSGQLAWGAGTSDYDTTLTRVANQGLRTERKLLATQGIGVGNSVSASVIPTANLVRKIQIFDENGASLGFIPVYSAIT